MITIRIILTSALMTVTTATNALASYTGPDNIQYNYKIVNWFRKEINQGSFNFLENGSISFRSNGTNDIYISGIVVLGPNSFIDYSATKQTVDITRIEDWSFNWTYYSSTRKIWKFTPTSNIYRSREYTNDSFASSPSLITTGPITSGGSLGLSYPTTITGGTTISGTGYITVIGPEPDPITGTPGYYSPYIDASNYGIQYNTNGVQEWAMITWTNDAPATLVEPEDPDWVGPDFEDQ